MQWKSAKGPLQGLARLNVPSLSWHWKKLENSVTLSRTYTYISSSRCDHLKSDNLIIALCLRYSRLVTFEIFTYSGTTPIPLPNLRPCAASLFFSAKVLVPFITINNVGFLQPSGKFHAPSFHHSWNDCHGLRCIASTTNIASKGGTLNATSRASNTT